jgi:hypothetical protein
MPSRDRVAAQLPEVLVVDDEDGVAAAAEELVEELLDELVELVLDVEAPVVAVVPDDATVDDVFVALATDVVDDWVDAAIAPVSASIPATLATPTARRERRAGWGRRRLAPGRVPRRAPRPGVGTPRRGCSRNACSGYGCSGTWGSGTWGSVIGNSWGRAGAADVAAPDDRARPSDDPGDALGPSADLRG